MVILVQKEHGACLSTNYDFMSKDGGFERKDGDFNDDFSRKKYMPTGDEFACKQGYCLRKNWWLPAKMNTLPEKVVFLYAKMVIFSKIRCFLPAKIRWYFFRKKWWFDLPNMLVYLSKMLKHGSFSDTKSAEEPQWDIARRDIGPWRKCAWMILEVQVLKLDEVSSWIFRQRYSSCGWGTIRKISWPFCAAKLR